MDASRRTWFDDRGLAIASGSAAAADPRRLPWYAGGLHYWRLQPRQWPTCLRQLRDLGLTVVDTPVPWRVHAPTATKHAWAGPCDLDRFLTVAADHGLAVGLRVGPTVDAGLTGFGLPDFVLAEPACQARTARDTPAWLPAPPRAFPIPSYASTAFHAHVRRWYAEVARIVAPRLAPDGPVVALGLDHPGPLWFRTGAFDLDYHPDAIGWWHEASGLASAPPRAWHADDAARVVAWLRFKDHYVARALGQFARSLDDVGLGVVARLHGVSPGLAGTAGVRQRGEAIGGPIGIAASMPRAEFRELRRRTTALISSAAPVPLATEVGVGGIPWLPPLDAGDDPTRERDQLLVMLAAGVRGFGLETLVERDRHHGAAITADGKLVATAAWIAPLVAALTEVDWPSLRRHPRPALALITSEADARHGHATNLLDPLTPVLAEALGVGPGGAAELGTDRGAIAARRWHVAVTAALDLAQVPYAIIDDATPAAELAGYRVLIAPTTARIDRELDARLRVLAEDRHHRVVLGPETPTLDETGAPLGAPPARRIGKIRDGSLEDLPGLASDLAALAGAPRDAWLVERPDQVRVHAFADPAGAVRALFVVSDADQPTTAIVRTGDEVSRRDPFTGEQFTVADGRCAIAVPARGIRFLI